MLTGTAMMQSDGTWTLSLLSDAGRKCEGTLIHDSARRLEGPISCDDGTAGEISMLFNQHRGLGTGRIGEETFTMKIGDE